MTGMMPRQWRAIAIFWTLAIWFGSFFGALAEQQRAHRLAANPVVTATVREAWSEHQKGGPVPYAHIEYDRKESDGQTVHCDVPWVNVGGLGRMLSAGDTVMIAPIANECWEPDLICETCAPWTPRHIAMMYMVSALSGLLCVFLIWQAIRDMRRNDTTNAKVA